MFLWAFKEMGRLGNTERGVNKDGKEYYPFALINEHISRIDEDFWFINGIFGFIFLKNYQYLFFYVPNSIYLSSVISLEFVLKLKLASLKVGQSLVSFARKRSKTAV